MVDTVHRLSMIILNCLFCYWLMMLFCCQKRLLVYRQSLTVCTIIFSSVKSSKSNIVVFRKGGYLGARERWTYDSVVLPVVNVYK